VTIAERLGVDYRRSTLLPWDNGERPFMPAEQLASAWRQLSFRVAADCDVFLREDES